MNRRQFIRNSAGLLVPASLVGTAAAQPIPAPGGIGLLYHPTSAAACSTDLLLAFQNNYTDSSSQAQTITANGSLAFTTSNPLYQTFSLSNTAQGSAYASAPVGGVNNPGSSDWTFEGWYWGAWQSTGTSAVASWGCSAAGFPMAGILRTSSIVLTLYGGHLTLGGGYALSGVTGSITDSTWVHVAIVRQGATLYGYVGGVSAGSGSIGSGPYTGTVAANAIGGDPTVWGSVEDTAQWYDWRWTVGLARYPNGTSFSVPSGPLGTSCP